MPNLWNGIDFVSFIVCLFYGVGNFIKDDRESGLEGWRDFDFDDDLNDFSF
jgi:hypothetical protein